MIARTKKLFGQNLKLKHALLRCSERYNNKYVIECFNINIEVKFILFQFDELESLGYYGLAVAFQKEDVLLSSTSTAEKCVTADFLEYVRAIIISGIYQHPL